MTIYGTNSETYIEINPATGRAWRSAEWIVESPDKWIYTKYNENGTVNRRSVYESPGAGERQQERIRRAKEEKTA